MAVFTKLPPDLNTKPALSESDEDASVYTELAS
jgi:hypothetical protein